MRLLPELEKGLISVLLELPAYSPWRDIRPVLQLLLGPFRRFISVARGTRIRDLVSIRHSRTDEPERVAPHIDVSNRLLDFRHVTGNTLVPYTSRLMMSVFFNGGRMRPVRRAGAMAFQAHHSGGFD